MKRVLFLLVAMSLIVSMAFGFQYLNIRPQGVNTLPTSTYSFVCDSTDTFQVDTFYSDTFDVGDYKYINYKLQLTGYSLADSANDSVVIVVKGIGQVDGGYPITVITDTIPTTLGTLDSTAVISGIAKVDTLPVSKMFFETVVSDSFILGAGVDTTELRLRYGVIKQIVLDR